MGASDFAKLPHIGEAIRRTGRGEAAEVGTLGTEIPAVTLPAHVDGKPVLGISDDTLQPIGFEAAGVFVYDRIETAPAHRRRGLGRAVMAALADARRSRAASQVLVATDDGRALYARLGWSVYSTFATAVIPEDPANRR